jgi:hypothetical protein
MEDNTSPAPAPAEDFDLSEIDAVDEAEMTVVSNGKLTSWTWRFAGPGHQQTREWGDKRARDMLHRERMQEQARVNGKKWKAEEETPEQRRSDNADIVLGRLLGWSPIKMNGQDYPFSRENAKALLLDPRKGQLLTQALEFLGEESSFTNRSENN